MVLAQNPYRSWEPNCLKFLVLGKAETDFDGKVRRYNFYAYYAVGRAEEYFCTSSYYLLNTLVNYFCFILSNSTPRRDAY